MCFWMHSLVHTLSLANILLFLQTNIVEGTRTLRSVLLTRLLVGSLALYCSGLVQN